MIQRTALMTALMAALVAPPVVAQPAKARATANVDLDARFKEAQTSPQLADDLYKVGRKVAAVCANCHGEGGTSTKPSIPNLAGQNPAYLLEQMRQFADAYGLTQADYATRTPHAWQAGPQTSLLASQLATMQNGIFVMTIPKAPYRCPPGPYERACLVANYFKKAKPKSKVLVLDANEEITSKKALFTKAFEKYAGILEYRPNSELREVDAAGRTAILEFDKVKADVLNVVPPQRAGDIAAKSGLKLINNRWVDIDWLTYESVNTPGVHVLGDAIFPAPTMPKSGHMANQHAKVAAAAILRLLAGEAPNPTPVVMNTCYSFVDSKNVIHVTSVHQYDAEKKTVLPVPGSGGVSAAANEIEGKAAMAWARNIWADMLV